MARSSRPVRLVLPGLLLVAVPWSAAVEAGSGALAGACGEFRGDCNGDGRVSIGELQRALAMSLGSQAPACSVDADGDAAVSGAELQAVVDAFLGMRVPPSVSVFPAGATVAAGASEPFGAAVLGCGEETSVSWSVEEAGGGAVTHAGGY